MIDVNVCARAEVMINQDDVIRRFPSEVSISIMKDPVSPLGSRVCLVRAAG